MHIIHIEVFCSGYMAPEYAMRGHLTNKADVYSFGVVTLEIVSGKNSTSYRPNDENVYLLDLVSQNYTQTPITLLITFIYIFCVCIAKSLMS